MLPAKLGNLTWHPDENADRKGGSSQIKIHRRDEPIFAPRSLFDRPSPAVAKLRRDYKLQKMNMASQNRLYTPPMSPSPPTVLPVLGKSPLGAGAVTFPVSLPASPKSLATVPPSTPAAPDFLEWLSTEDYSLLQVSTSINHCLFPSRILRQRLRCVFRA